MRGLGDATKYQVLCLADASHVANLQLAAAGHFVPGHQRSNDVIFDVAVRQVLVARVLLGVQLLEPRVEYLKADVAIVVPGLLGVDVDSHGRGFATDDVAVDPIRVRIIRHSTFGFYKVIFVITGGVGREGSEENLSGARLDFLRSFCVELAPLTCLREVRVFEVPPTNNFSNFEDHG